MKRIWQLCAMIVGMVFVLSGCAGKEAGQPGEEPAAVSARPAGSFKMTFLDTGKSDCIIMEAGDFVVVNDTADEDDAAAICAFLDERQAERIDYLILSHFDKDHIGSAALLLTEYEVGCVLMPQQEKDSEPYLMLTEALAQTKTEEKRLLEDCSFTLAGVAFTVDAPDEDFYEDDNNYSLITTVTFGGTRFLLMGDALKKRTGEFLYSNAGEEHYDLIKMPHHGDYNKKLPDLLAIARPDYVVLTAGKERERVEDKTVELLEKAGCQVFYTDEGNVTVLSDGQTVTLMQ